MTLHQYPEITQGSPEWHDIRRGVITASTVGKLITIGAPDALTVDCPACLAPADEPCISTARKTPTPIKTIHEPRTAKTSNLPPVYEVANNDTSRGLTATLVAERIAGFTEDLPMTSDMWRGVEAEPYAREVYAKHRAPVEEIGFMVRVGGPWSLGYSPDGLVGDDGLIEIKSPRAKTHLLTILRDEVPAHYMAQCQAGLFVSGRKWCDFVSYVGGLPLWIKRVEPDERWFDAITDACITFEQAATEMTSKYLTAVAGLPETERVLELEMVI